MAANCLLSCLTARMDCEAFWRCRSTTCSATSSAWPLCSAPGTASWSERQPARGWEREKSTPEDVAMPGGVTFRYKADAHVPGRLGSALFKVGLSETSKTVASKPLFVFCNFRSPTLPSGLDLWGHPQMAPLCGPGRKS